MEKLETQFKRGMEHNYIIVKCAEQELSDYQTKMLTENRIKNMLDLSVKRNNGVYDFCYEVSSLQPVARVFERRQIGYEGILSIINGILSGVRSAHEYMLDEDDMVITPDNLYMNVETMDLGIMLYPYYKGNIHDSFVSLAEYILDKADHNDSRAVMLAYDLFKVVRNESFTIRSLDSVIEKVSGINSNVVNNEDYSASSDAERVNHNYCESVKEDSSVIYEKNIWEYEDDSYGFEEKEQVQEPKKTFFGGLLGKSKKDNKKKHEPQMEEIRISEEYDYVNESPAYIEPDNSSYGKTVLLSLDNNGNEGLSCKGLLKYVEGRKEKSISLETLPITIGKVDSCVDVVVKDSSISRMHATIYEDKGIVRIKDLGSTNGTFVNSIMISEDESIPIEIGDEIKLGKVKFKYE